MGRYEQEHLKNETAAENCVNKLVDSADDYNNSFEQIAITENIKTNLMTSFELQDISDTLNGILQWLIIMVLILAVILYKLW